MENIDFQAIELALLGPGYVALHVVGKFISALRKQISEDPKKYQGLSFSLSYDALRKIFREMVNDVLFSTIGKVEFYIGPNDRPRIYRILMHDNNFIKFLTKKPEFSTDKQPEVPQKSESSTVKQPEVPQKSKSSTDKQPEVQVEKKKPRLFTDAELEEFGSRVQAARELRLKREFEHIVRTAVADCLFDSNIVVYSNDNTPYSNRPSLVKALLSYDFGDFQLESNERGIVVSFKK